MPKGKPNKKYSGEFKQLVVETLRSENLGYIEAMRQFELGDYHIIQRWERIYLEEGAGGLYIERRGRASAANGIQKGRKPELSKQVEKT